MPSGTANPSIVHAVIVVFLLVLTGCMPVRLSAKVGYARTQIGGRLALDSGQGGSQAALEQDVETAFGLGDGQGSPFVRAQADFGAPVLTASVLWLRESGQGELDGSFGGLPASTPVTTELDLGVSKISAVYDIDLGPLKIAPGVMFDVFALDFSARELTLGSREEIDDVVFVPMPFLRAEGGSGSFTGIAEFGYLEVSSLGDNSGRFVDFEAILEWSPVPLANVFCGYRYVGIDVNGNTNADAFAADLSLRGWVLGGGVRF